ncbi:MAG: GNAT family N-acetyltransferase [Pseudomonadota bacterium]
MTTETTNTSALKWLVERKPDQGYIDALHSALIDYNIKAAAIDQTQNLAVFIRDEQDVLMGGIAGRTWGQCLEIQYLWIHDELRGQGHGVKLIQALEQEALVRQCYSVVVDTFSFQAPGLYQKLGYEVLGVIDGYPDDIQKVFLKKHLA